MKVAAQTLAHPPPCFSLLHFVSCHNLNITSENRFEGMS